MYVTVNYSLEYASRMSKVCLIDCSASLMPAVVVWATQHQEHVDFSRSNFDFLES